MKDSKFLYILIAALFTVMLVVFIFNTCGYIKDLRDNIKTDTITIEKTDTVVIRDTITITQPIPIKKEIVRYDTISVLSHDTASQTAVIPIESTTYQDSLYKAVVSGYKANLDTIEVYPKTTYITKEITKTITKKNHLGFGIQAGYGYAIKYQGLTPYIGLGIHLNF